MTESFSGKRGRAFTLIELLLVIAILTALLLPAIATGTANDAST